MKGLVLEGGGVKGSYQVGSYYAFRDCHIKIDGFVGTSIGSFNALMLASHKELELLDFWYNVNPGLLLGFDEDFVELFNGGDLSFDSIKGAFDTLKAIVKNVGLDNSGMYKAMYKIVDFNALMNSKCDFGLVTVKMPKMKPIYVTKEMLKDKKHLCEYVMASCNLPIFRNKKLVDDHYYIDGGFYDNSPTKLLVDKKYKTLYVINIKGIGINRTVRDDRVKIINIKPSRDNGKIMELDISIIRENIKMGYYDTLRVLKRLDGYKYCFKRKRNWYYNFLVRKVDKRLLKRVNNFFKAESNKELVIKAIEYVLEKEGIDYYDIYNVSKMIKFIKKKDSNHFVYRFIKSLKFF